LFFDFPCSLSSESSELHLPTNIVEVLRLRAINSPLCDRSAGRFAQDDAFNEEFERALMTALRGALRGSEDIWLGGKSTKGLKKSQALGMTNLFGTLDRTCGLF
jgi:hypothetical protein